MGCALATVAVVTMLAGCGALGGDADDEPDEDATSTTIDAALLECGDPTNGDPTLQLTDVDLSAATWEMPDGFAETFEYKEDYAVEHVESFWAAIAEEDPVPLNVLAVVVYSDVDWGEAADECGRVAVTAIEERLTTYMQQTGATALGEATSTEIAGQPAMQQDLSLPEYSYRGYWVFGRTQLVHLYCQWTGDDTRDAILAGCEDLLASFEVPGA